MNKFLHLFTACLLSSFLLISCSSGLEKTGEVSLVISNDSVARLTARDADSNSQSDYSIKVQLTTESTTQEQAVSISNNKKNTEVTFTELTIGETAKVEAWLYYGENVLSTGSSDSFTIQEGNNSVSIKFIVKGNNTEVQFTPIKKHFEIRTIEGTSETFEQIGGGKIVFSLFDEDGNDVLADIDWTKEGSQSVWKRFVEIHYGTETEDFNDFTYDNNVITFNSFNNFGIFFVTITVSPLSGSYVNTSNETIEIPDFEPVTNTIEINVIETH